MSLTDSEFALMFIISTVGMLLMALAIILFVVFYQKKMLQEQLKRQQMEAEFQKKMLQAALDSQENERRRVAADLHDSIGAMLSTIRLSLATLARINNMDPDAIIPTKQMLDETIDSVRAISRDLMPATLEKFGISQAVKEMCERISVTTNLSTIFKVSGEPVELDDKEKTMMFRIVQELLNNAIKHSGATEIFVDFEWSDSLSVSVKDNGRGFEFDGVMDEKKQIKGLGLFNIENRSQLMGASVKFENAKPGTQVTILLPLKNEQEVNSLHS